MPTLIEGRSQYERSIPEIRRLFAAAFGKDISAEFLQWRYLRNPVGDLLACTEVQADSIIANYSASPCILSARGVTTKSALSMTTMTDPAHSGRGYFTSLASHLYESMAHRGYDLIWGFPNHASHRGFIKNLGWKDVYEIPTMVGEVRPNNASPQADVARDDEFSLDYSRFAPSHADLWHVRKDAAYLRWRYASNPQNRYANLVIESSGVVSSFCVCKSYGKDADLVDVQAKDAFECEHLIKRALEWAASQGLHRVNLWAPTHHFLHPLLERMGFRHKEPITYFGLRQLRAGGALDDIASYRNWYLQMGDSDVY